MLKLQLGGCNRDVDDPGDAHDLSCLEEAIREFAATHNILKSGRFAASKGVLFFSPLAQQVSSNEVSGIDMMLEKARRILKGVKAGEAPDAALMEHVAGVIQQDALATLQRVVEALEAEFSARSQEQADTLSVSVSDAQKAIERIDRVARHSKLVSLNARVAAGRAGPFGEEFSALSREIKHLADRMLDAADDVQNCLKDIA
ncbi:methyl-accepting chemotaxis protein [Cohaesibacter sp. ES.047]|uniref:methyl-accepting chemotaxis protein n=1 Tax=Cohaesibacter sp. ES.047 TaxID=1798205 RepID=UPI00352A6324